MKSKLFLLVLGLGILLLTTGMNGGCGESFHDEIGYYYPNWSTDGRIIAVKSVTRFKDEGLPGYGRSMEISHTEYIVLMKDDGTDERTIYGGEGKGIGIIVASPLGNYIGYQSGQYINIITADGTREVKTIDCGEEIYSFDWDPSDTKLVYNGTKEALVINIDGPSKKVIAANGTSVAWKYGDKIILDNPISSEVFRVVALSGYDYSEIGQFNKVQGGEFNISATNTNEVIYRSAYESGIKKFLLDSLGSDPVLLINRNDLWNIRLSPDGQKITASGDNIHGKGIWGINIDGSNLTKLRN